MSLDQPDRPELLHASPAPGASFVRADPPVEVLVRLRWSDGAAEECPGTATQWAWPGDGTPPVVHVTVDGARHLEQLDGWFSAVDVRRA